MRICILADETIKTELLQIPVAADTELVWVRDIEDLVKEKADAYMDLLFLPVPERITALKTLTAVPVFVNAVADTLEEIGAPFIRINGWPGFLNRGLAEIVMDKNLQAKPVRSVMQALGRDYRALPDEPGMIAPRVLAMIINEAYFALKEGVSTKEEIDIAMKLGTNYPMGPFEWSARIGLEKIGRLLDKLNENNERYTRAF